MAAQIRVLLVEDSDVTRAMLRDMIEHAYGVEEAETLAEAMERLRAGGIDAVVLDLTLPDANGLEAFEAVRAAVPAVPVVVVTGSDHEEFEQRAMAGGADSYLLKAGLNARELVRAIRQALMRE